MRACLFTLKYKLYATKGVSLLGDHSKQQKTTKYRHDSKLRHFSYRKCIDLFITCIMNKKVHCFSSFFTRITGDKKGNLLSGINKYARFGKTIVVT